MILPVYHYKTAILSITMVCLVLVANPCHGQAASAKTQYFKADRCHRLLKENSAHQKYRDRWLRCINGFLAAYKLEPRGPWAAASLYQAGSLYVQLYQRSYFEGDRQEALDIFDRIIRGYPKSQYRQKALKARADINPKGDTPSDGGDDAADRQAAPAADEVTKLIAGGAQDPPRQNPATSMATSQEPALVEGLRFWSNPRYTRVVIDASQDTAYTYHELREDPAIGKPQRIYIDVHNSRLGQGLQKLVPINDNLLRNARAGQYTQDTVRVVVDIKSVKTFKIFSLKNPFRVVLDVWGMEAAGSEAAGDGQPLSSALPQGKDGKKIQPSAIAKQLALGVRRIVIDPGHGGKDYGAPGYLKGVHEKQVVMQIAKTLRQMVNDQLKCEVVLTRDGDRYLSLEERTAIANTQNADLFISIHTNASQDRRAYGVETYILNLATDDEAIRVAAMENATSAKNISDLDSILHDLMQNAKVNESTRLAGYVQQAMYGQLKGGYSQIRNKGIKQAPFYVLLGADMPSILVETSFISHPRECKRLVDPAYQRRLCQGIVEGIKRYIKETNPLAFEPMTPLREKG